MFNMIELCENVQIITLHLLNYQDILNLIKAYTNAQGDPTKLFYFRKLLQHVLVLSPSHLHQYLSTPLNGALPYHQLSLEKQYYLIQPTFRNTHQVIQFLKFQGRDEEKRYFLENHLYFGTKFKNQELINQWIKQILESEFKFHEHPEIISTLAYLYGHHKIFLTWDLFNQIHFKDILDKILFFYQLINNLHFYSNRRELLLGFVNSDIPFEYKQRLFNLGLDNHLYSASKAHFKAFLGIQSTLSRNEQLILIYDAIQKPIMNLAFLISFKNHPLYNSVMPSSRLQAHYDCIDRLEISETSVLNTIEKFIINVNYKNHYNPMEIEGIFTPAQQLEMASLYGFIVLNTVLSFFQNNPEQWYANNHLRTSLFNLFQHHPHPIIEKYLRHVQYFQSSDINLDPELLIQQMLYENNTQSPLHTYLFLKLNRCQFNRTICWLDLNRYTSALLSIYSTKTHDKYLCWWLNNLEKKLFHFKNDYKFDTFRLKIKTLGLLIKGRGIQAHYLNEILKNLNFLESVHLFRHNLRHEDYRIVRKLLNLSNQNLTQLTHQQKMNMFLKKLFTNPYFQLKNPLENQKVYLKILVDPDILLQFKIQIIFAIYIHAQSDMRLKLLEHLTRIHEQNPHLIHKVIPFENYIKMNMALLSLNPYKSFIEINKLMLIITLFKENTLIYRLPQCSIDILRNLFISIITQTLMIDLALEIGRVILKASPHEHFYQCDFLFHHLINCPYLRIEHQAKIVQYLFECGEKIIETKAYHHLLRTLENPNANLIHQIK